MYNNALKHFSSGSIFLFLFLTSIGYTFADDSDIIVTHGAGAPSEIIDCSFSFRRQEPRVIRWLLTNEMEKNIELDIEFSLKLNAQKIALSKKSKKFPIALQARESIELFYDDETCPELFSAKAVITDGTNNRLSTTLGDSNGDLDFREFVYGCAPDPQGEPQTFCQTDIR